MSKQKKKTADDLLTLTDFSVITKCVYTTELAVSGVTQPELTNCVLQDENTVGLTQLQVPALPATAFTNQKQAIQSALLVFPPNSKIGELTTPHFVAGKQPGICDTPTALDEWQIYKKLQVPSFSIAFMNIFKSQANNCTCSQNQYQLMLHLNTLNTLKQSLLGMFNNKTFQNTSVQIDKTAQTFCPIQIGPTIINVPITNFVQNGQPWYLNQQFKFVSNEGVQVEQAFAYPVVLNALTESTQQSILDLLDTLMKQRAPTHRIKNEYKKNKLVTIKTLQFKNYLKDRFLQFFTYLIQKQLLKGQVRKLEYQVVTKRSTSPTKEIRSPSKGKQVRDTKQQFEEVKVQPAILPEYEDIDMLDDTQQMVEKYKLLEENIIATIDSLSFPDQIEIPIIDLQETNDEVYIKLAVNDSVLATVLNSFDSISDNQQVAKIYSLLRILSKKFNTMMPGQKKIRFEDYVKPAEPKKKQYLTDDQIQAEKKLPILRKLIVDEVHGEQKSKKNVVADYEEVWADRGDDDDLFEDVYENMDSCWVKMSEIGQYFDELVCYSDKEESRQVMFKTNANVKQVQKGKETVVNNQCQNFYQFDMSCMKQAQVDKVQPNPLRKQLNSTSTPSDFTYYIRIDQIDPEAVLNFSTKYIKESPTADCSTKLQFVWFDSDQNVHQLIKAYKQNTYICYEDFEGATALFINFEFYTNDTLNLRGGYVTMTGSCTNASIISIEMNAQNIENYQVLQQKTQPSMNENENITCCFELQLDPTKSPLALSQGPASDIDNESYAEFEQESEHIMSTKLLEKNSSMQYLLLNFEFQEPVPALQHTVTIIDQSKNAVLENQEIQFMNKKAQLTLNKKTLEDLQIKTLYVLLKSRMTVRQKYDAKDKKVPGCFPTSVKLHVFGPGLAKIVPVEIQEQAESTLMSSSELGYVLQNVMNQTVIFNANFETRPESKADAEKTRETQNFNKEVVISFLQMPEIQQKAVVTKQDAKQQPVITQNLQIYLQETAQTLQTQSQPLPVIESLEMYHNRAFIVKCTEPTLSFKITGSSEFRLQIFSAEQLQLTQMNLNEVVLSQISQNIFTKDYITQTEQFRKAFANNLQVQTTDLNKIQFAQQMKVQLQTEQKQNKKGVEIQQPGQQLQIMFTANKMGQFDTCLQDDVMGGVPTDPKKKAAEKKGAISKGFIGEILEQNLKSVAVDRQTFCQQVQIKEVSKKDKLVKMENEKKQQQEEK
ncbi:Conserved_hypothetical protein [Hexamita inflata]|uniref:Uncharacterized protein n=1 Tax=Hexamita inflata TaxID=28002 RepID=A0AA86U9Q8_9EUKA|nr:Conserved hypothetical protein [Hexamita inflata]